MSEIDTAKLAATIADAYTVDELRGFLADYFQIRLDHIINPTGIGFIAIVRAVVEYFARNHLLTQLVRELSKDRPGVIDLMDLWLPVGAPLGGPAVPTSTASIDIGRDELDFYFVIEPDRRTVPPPRGKQVAQSIYVRIPVVTGGSGRTSAPRALALAVDRSGSMQGHKIDVACAAADYLVDLTDGTADRIAIVAFDHRIDVVVDMRATVGAAQVKARLRGLVPSGRTDLFAAWTRCVEEARTLDDSWERRLVLITDGQLNLGMADPAHFERVVHECWTRERIATSCITMGADWNVDLLNRLAGAGGGSLHFIDDVRQAEQALHEAFHAGSGIVANDVRAELKPLGSARVTQVQGVAVVLAAGGVSTHSITSQLRTNVEESLVLRIDFTPPPPGQAIDVLRCRILYDDPVDARTRVSSEKVLQIYTEEAGAEIVHRGVLCTAHATMSSQLFRRALTAFLHEDAAGGQQLLKQSRFALEATDAPRGYRAAVGFHRERLDDLARFEGRVPAEYIKERYIEQLTHRDVVWIRLCEILDRITAVTTEGSLEYAYDRAGHLVGEFAERLPVQAGRGRNHGGDDPARDREGSNRDYWIAAACAWIERRPRREQHDLEGRDHRAEREARTAYVVAGACCSFEARRQGTRDELRSLMTSYLSSSFERRDH